MGSPNLNLGDFYLLVCPYSFHPPLTPSPCTNRHSHTHIHTHRNTPESHTHTETQTETYTESYTRTHGNIHRVTHTHTLGHRVFRDCVACIHHSVLSAPRLQYYLIFFLQQPFKAVVANPILQTGIWSPRDIKCVVQVSTVGKRPSRDANLSPESRSGSPPFPPKYTNPR